jgi:hypothetical protein
LNNSQARPHTCTHVNINFLINAVAMVMARVAEPVAVDASNINTYVPYQILVHITVSMMNVMLITRAVTTRVRKDVDWMHATFRCTSYQASMRAHSSLFNTLPPAMHCVM